MSRFAARPPDERAAAPRRGTRSGFGTRSSIGEEVLQRPNLAAATCVSNADVAGGVPDSEPPTPSSSSCGHVVSISVRAGASGGDADVWCRAKPRMCWQQACRFLGEGIGEAMLVPHSVCNRRSDCFELFRTTLSCQSFQTAFGVVDDNQ